MATLSLCPSGSRLDTPTELPDCGAFSGGIAAARASAALLEPAVSVPRRLLLRMRRSCCCTFATRCARCSCVSGPMPGISIAWAGTLARCPAAIAATCMRLG